MKIADTYNLQKIIREMEMMLQVDGSDFELRDMNAFIDKVKRRINQQYNLDITHRKVTDPDLELGAEGTQVANFLDILSTYHAKLCGYCQVVRYRRRIDVSLANINWMGYTEETMKTTLNALQVESTVALAEDAFEAIKLKLSTIPMCWEKRILVLMVLLHELGCDEVVASMAEILYIGTLV